MKQPNFFDDPKATTTPQKQDTGIGLPAYMPKSTEKNILKMTGGDTARAQQIAKDMFTKPDNRI